jgi:Holliday junction resolvase-like predicted endonuclease
VAANFSLPIGRNTRDVIVNAEIDLVAYDGGTLCFVEVKTRASDEIAPPQMNCRFAQAPANRARGAALIAECLAFWMRRIDMMSLA